MAKFYEQDLSRCFALNANRNGLLDRKQYEQAVLLAKEARSDLVADDKSAKAIFSSITGNNLSALQQLALDIRENFSALVLIGTGGSTLNPQAILAIKATMLDNLGPRDNFKIFFADTLDSAKILSINAQIDLKNTAFLAISKSGTTLEVIATVMFFITQFEQMPNYDYGKNFIVISDPVPSTLREIAAQIGSRVINHEALVGGRFASFTNVTLLPMMIAGLDASSFVAAAKSVLDDFYSDEDFAAVHAAACSYSALKSGHNINIFMPYIYAMKDLTSWICQIWAESLGKNSLGSTPVRAMGSIDQHSQLQLYLDGPVDKFFTIIKSAGEAAANGAIINYKKLQIAGADYLNGKNFDMINLAAADSTIASLYEHKRPVRVLTVGKLDTATMGALMLHFIIETLLMARMLGVNAFDQPAVEHGKKLARAKLEN